MQDLNQRVINAQNDTKELELLIKDYEFYILRCAKDKVGRYVDKSDDEWSVALSAFFEAVRLYKPDKGSFLRFSELVIGRRLTDHYRKETRLASETSIDPSVLDGEIDENAGIMESAVIKKISLKRETGIADEIEAVSKELQGYGISFMDLAGSSPHSHKTRELCKKAIRYLLENKALLKGLEANGQLPISILVRELGIKRKPLENYRRYIVAAVMIMSGDYPYLQDYLKYLND